MKILIVEDDPVASALLVNILQSDGYQATVADDGEVAWALLDDPGRYFDVVLLDLSLPKLDGISLWGRIRSSPFLRSVEVIPCTASSDRATVLKVAQLGAHHYMVKPINPEKLRTALGNVQQQLPAGVERNLVVC